MLSYLQTRLYTLLRWSERYTKTDMLYLAKNGSWLGLGHVVLALIAFLLSIAFARLVPKDAYGTYRFLLSLYWTLTAFTLSGLPIAMSRMVAKGFDRVYPRAFVQSIFWSLPSGLVACGVAAYYFYQGNTMLALGSVMIAIVGPFTQSAYLYGSFLEGKRRFKENALFGIALNGIPALGLFVSMVFTKNILVFLAVNLAGTVLTGFVLAYLSYRLYANRNSQESSLRELLSQSGHFSAMNILSTISQQVDRLLVYHFLGAVELAVYTFATSMPDQIRTVFNNIATVAFPKFVNRTPEEIQATLMHRLLALAGVVLVIALIYIELAPFAFHLLFPAYAESIPYSQLYALTLLAIPNIIPLSILQAHVAKRELYAFNIITPLFQIGLMVIGILTYGLVGIIAARVVSRFFNVALSAILMRSYFAKSAARARDRSAPDSGPPTE